jgi:hypothetical protein
MDTFLFADIHVILAKTEDNVFLTFLWGYLKAQVFTRTLPDINSLKNAVRQEIANVTQDTYVASW